MTTICWDGKSLAWDSQLTIGDIKQVGDKSRVLCDGSRIVVCGSFSTLDAFVDTLNETGEPAEAVEAIEEDSMVVHLRVDGSLWVYTDEAVWRVRAPCAWGSGKASAFTALQLGQNAKEAVATACKVDLYSSLPVHSACAGRQRRRKG